MQMWSFLCLLVCLSVCLSVLQVVLASLPDLGTGFARDLFASWCSDQKNTVIFTSRTSPGTLARELLEDPTKASIELEVIGMWVYWEVLGAGR